MAADRVVRVAGRRPQTLIAVLILILSAGILRADSPRHLTPGESVGPGFKLTQYVMDVGAKHPVHRAFELPWLPPLLPALAEPPTSTRSAQNAVAVQNDLQQWRLEQQRLAKGSTGEVWRGTRSCGGSDKDSGGCSQDQRYVLKRMFLDRGPSVLRSGLREIYFGKNRFREPPCDRSKVKDACAGRTAEYVTHFYERRRDIEGCQEQSSPPSSTGDDKAIPNDRTDNCSRPALWLVFKDEGMS